jgi:hypothetical protein
MANSNGVEGAASAALSITIPEDATLAQIDRAEQMAYDAIVNVDDPDAAETLLKQVTLADHAARLMEVGAEREQRWRGLRLRAERRYGELLGPAKRGNPNVTRSHIDATTRKNSERARKVASVSGDVFENYLADTEKPTREGLFATATSPPTRPRAKVGSPADAAERLRGRVKFLRTLRAQRRHWTQQDMDDIDYVLDHPPKRRAKYSGKRLRELGPKWRNGNDLAGLQYRMMQLTSILESVDVTSYDLADADDVSDFHDDLVQLQIWMDRSIGIASSRLDDVALERKIRKLRDGTGRTEAERRTAAMLAEKLERRRRERHLVS